MTLILEGKKLANEICEGLKKEVEGFTKKPKLAVILVGYDNASLIYVNSKQKKAAEIGIESVFIQLDENISEQAVLEHIDILNEDDDINAILVQLPLPWGINANKILNRIAPIKDVDGFTNHNAGLIATTQKPYAYPATAKGIVSLLEYYKLGVEGKHVVIIGRSNIVGKPLAQMLLNKNATVTIAHSRTVGLKEIAKTADILVSAVGCKGLITSDFVKAGAVVIDVGINRNDENKVVGDVDFETVKEIAGAITPVPKGVGPMTIASLMQNTVELYRIQNEKDFR